MAAATMAFSESEEAEYKALRLKALNKTITAAEKRRARELLGRRRAVRKARKKNKQPAAYGPAPPTQCTVAAAPSGREASVHVGFSIGGGCACCTPGAVDGLGKQGPMAF